MATTTLASPRAPEERTPSQPAEESGLARIAGWCHDHRWWVLVLWLVALVGSNVAAQTAGSNFSNNLTGGAQPVQQILDQAFPSQRGTPAQVVITTTGPITAPAVQERTAKLVAALTPLAHVSHVTSPFAADGAHQISKDGHIAYVQVNFDQQAGTLPEAAINTVISTAQSFEAPGYHVSLGGQAISLVAGGKPGSSEGIGILAAVIIMLLAFGSVVAMGLPIITALFGIAVSFALLDLLSHVITTPTFAPEMMAMIGLGVGIDYALFIVTRFRQGLAEGRTPRQATAVSLATSGRSVVFAGTTVILSLLGLFILQLPFMRGLAVGAIAAVVLVMLAAITLLPAMLGFSGLAIDKLHLPGLLQNAAEPSPRGFWYRWSRTVQRHPICSGLAALVCLVLLALPFFSMRLAFTDAGNDPTSSTTRQAFDALASGFGPGFNGPLIVAASVPDGRKTTVEAVRAAVAATPGVVFTTPAQFSASGRDAVMVAYPATSPQSAQTEAIVHTLRSRTIPAATAGTGVVAYVGGETAGSVDASSYLSSRLVWVIGVVLLLAFLLLMSVFRSVAIPIKAVVVNMLSVGAAYGVVVAVFQWGWLGGVIGIGSTGPIDPWIPLMMFTILFGLSMDYEVFLLSRIREEWRRTGDNSTAVADGLAKTARVITAAAAIMICVFGSFVIGDPLHVLKVFGLGLAAAILIDATLVRMVLVPSIMELLGPANWWMPSWLDRIVPNLGVEVDASVPHPAPAAAPEG
ncbi:MAG TPA: MMPL family transporter [Acidimicrobiales bacterium]|jgi:RND superfamily putative drug exporter|nr:MMPL family transporter [Acidimicrobiales bacterium]